MGKEIDIIISGAGLAGKIAAYAFGKKGHSVALIEARKKNNDKNFYDFRSTAFLAPSCRFFKALGLWDVLVDKATPLRAMRVIEKNQARAVNYKHYDFAAHEIGETEFGWNIGNQILHNILDEKLNALETVDIHFSTQTKTAFARQSEIYVCLSDKTRYKARLLIGADGRLSQVRDFADISVSTFYHGQKALAFHVTHPLAHDNISTEIYESGGPFTLVPMPDFEGMASSAVIWMGQARHISRLAGLKTDAFNEAITARSCEILGKLSLIEQRRMVWSIVTQLAAHPTGQRIALIGEALHIVPPIGAQGLNMTIGDIRALLEYVGDDIGGKAHLAAYSSARKRRVTMRSMAIWGLDIASYLDGRGLGALRGVGLGLLDRVPLLRRKIMKFGMGG